MPRVRLKQPYSTTRIWDKTLNNLRLIYSATGEMQVWIIDRLVEAELNRIKELYPGILEGGDNEQG